MESHHLVIALVTLLFIVAQTIRQGKRRQKKTAVKAIEPSRSVKSDCSEVAASNILTCRGTLYGKKRKVNKFTENLCKEAEVLTHRGRKSAYAMNSISEDGL